MSINPGLAWPVGVHAEGRCLWCRVRVVVNKGRRAGLQGNVRLRVMGVCRGMKGEGWRRPGSRPQGPGYSSPLSQRPPAGPGLAPFQKEGLSST